MCRNGQYGRRLQVPLPQCVCPTVWNPRQPLMGMFMAAILTAIALGISREIEVRVAVIQRIIYQVARTDVSNGEP
jgi:hypothetical protein